MAITDWPLAERPREKLLAQGVSALSDAELLAVFVTFNLIAVGAPVVFHVPARSIRLVALLPVSE